MDLKASKAKLFLIELIIIILFFAFSGAVCMNMFAAASRMSAHSTELTNASMVAQSAAEVLKSGGEERLADVLGAQYADGSYLLYYDADWNTVSAAEGVYRMEIIVGSSGGLLDADVAVKKNENDLIYSIHAKRYEGEVSRAG
jgi:hypothetical protein